MNPFKLWRQGEHSIEVFDLMCKKHDLTYALSDCRETWVKGHEEMSDISEAAMLIGPQAKAIWNRNVLEKLEPQTAEGFMW